MQLTYRGIAYTQNSMHINTVESGAIAKFRGIAYRVRRPAEFLQCPSKTLVYRGVSRKLLAAAAPALG